MKKRALVVGRFQPLHYGHLHVFRYALGRAKELVIVIGSSQFCCVPRNPLSVDERMEMIVRALRRKIKILQQQRAKLLSELEQLRP